MNDSKGRTFLLVCTLTFTSVFSFQLHAQNTANHWETVVYDSMLWRYKNNADPGADWNTPLFNDQSWLQGKGGVGYSDNDDRTVVSASLSVFLRKKFMAGDVETVCTTDTSKAQAAVVVTKTEQIAKVAEQIKTADTASKTVLETTLKTLETEKAAARKAELMAIDWRTLWGLPAAFAGVILVLFTLFFRPPARVPARA